MGLTKIGPNHQIAIPPDAVKALHLTIGDILVGRVQEGKLVLVPRKRVKKTSERQLPPEEQKLLASAQRKIERIRRDPARARGLTDKEAAIAAGAGLIAREQRWWWSEPWQRGERRAERELRAGQTKTFDRVEDFIQDLRAR